MMLLRLELGSWTAAKPGRLPWANEDACFTAAPFAAVFDGVSSAARSRDYATVLAQSSRSFLLKSADTTGEIGWGSQAQQTLRCACTAGARIDGASTACLLRFDLERCVVACYNLGDCGFLLLEPGGPVPRVIGRSSPKIHADGTPFQLAGACGISDAVTSGALTSHALAAGQLALCFSDGLSGNLSPAEVADIVGRTPGLAPTRLARRLATEAQRRGTVR